MTVLKKYNEGTAQWEAIVSGVEGPTGPTGPTGPDPADIIAAKGDLLVGTADDTLVNVGVGANGTVLTADSAETSGVKWASTSLGGLSDVDLSGLADDDVIQYDSATGTWLPVQIPPPDESTYFIVESHGSNPSVARPSPAGSVYWIGSVAPDNAVVGDQWFDTTP